MGMPAQETDWTAEMARALPEDGMRHEVLDGVLFVSPAPSLLHQRAVGLLFEILVRYARETGVGEALLSPADLEFSPQRYLQPDVFVVPASSLRRSWRDVTSLLLVAEVLSPSTARANRHEKRAIYQDERIPDYWIVDLDGRVVEHWQPDDRRPEVLTDVLQWHPAGATKPLVIDLRRYFAAVLD
jgi:Uma2 family endonuclease